VHFPGFFSALPVKVYVQMSRAVLAWFKDSACRME
jgi:hypothetical protein